MKTVHETGARPNWSTPDGAEQWTVESIGYATNLGIITRLEAVVEMRFRTVPYLMYFRDVTALGTGYPVHELLKDENEREQRYGRSK